MAAFFFLAHLLFLPTLAMPWAASAAWVRWDAARRIRNRAAVRAATAAALALPFGGVVVWLCVRPAETLQERRARRLRELLLLLETAPEPAPEDTEPLPLPQPQPELVPVLRLSA